MRTTVLAIATMLAASTVFAGTTALEGALYLRSTKGSNPTCATAAGADGAFCAGGVIEGEGALNIAGASTLTGAATLSSTLTLAGVLTLNGGQGALTCGDGDCSLVLTDNDATAFTIGSTGLLNLLTLDTGDSTETVIVTGTTTVDAFHVDTGTSVFDEGADFATLAASLDVIRFCGNGPNATTTVYVGPVVEADFGTNMTYGEAGCDAKDNTTEATADAPWHPAFAFQPVAMVCVTGCGTDDTMTLQLRDDTANVTGMTCNITLTGSAAQCQVRDSTPATVAANSAVAISVVNDTDDDCSGAGNDVECRVYIDY